MAVLTLKFKENVIQDYVLKKGNSLAIGRRSSNDIVIDNLAVSGYHTNIVSKDSGFLLNDLKSKNGTFVNEKMVASCWLKNGDVITIGKHTLVFTDQEVVDDHSDGEDTLVFEDGLEDVDKTMMIQTEKHRDMVSRNPPSTPELQDAEKNEGSLVGGVSLLAGGEGRIELTKQLTRIGKDSSADIVIPGGLLSFLSGKMLATINNRSDQYFISTVGNTSKVKVNGKVIRGEVKLMEFDDIQIGSVKMQFSFAKKTK